VDHRQQIESLFRGALEQPAGERDAWLRKACSSDADLLREVNSLVANHIDEPTGNWAVLAAAHLVAGTGSSAQYIRTLRDPYINFSASSTPNIHGFVASIYASSVLEMILTGAVVLGFIWACKKTKDYEPLFGLSLLCGLLVSYHGGTGDLILVLPALVLMLPSAHKYLRMALVVAASPLPYLLPLSLGPPPAFLLTVALAVAGVRAASTSQLEASSLPELPIHRV